MDFATKQRDPKRHLLGIGFVVVFHALIIYAMVTGLARKAVDVIKKPIDVAIIEEVKPPPPPPPPPPPQKRIVQQAPPPPQPFVPPPEVVTPPTLEPPPIVAVAPTPPVTPHVIAPPPPPVVEAPPAPPPPPKPAVRQAVSCPTVNKPEYPRQAIRQGIQRGKVTARISVDERGNVLDVAIVSADPPRHFDRAVIDALSTWKCAAEGARYVGLVEVNFNLE